MPADAETTAQDQAQALVDAPGTPEDLRLVLKEALAAAEGASAGRAALKASVERLKAKDENLSEIIDDRRTGLDSAQRDAAVETGLAFRDAWNDKRQARDAAIEAKDDADDRFRDATAAWLDVRAEATALGEPDPIVARVVATEEALDAALGGMKPPIELALARIAEAIAHTFDFDEALAEIEARDPDARFATLFEKLTDVHAELEAAGAAQREAVKAAGAAQAGTPDAPGLSQFEASLTDAITKAISDRLEALAADTDAPEPEPEPAEPAEPAEAPEPAEVPATDASTPETPPADSRPSDS